MTWNTKDTIFKCPHKTDLAVTAMIKVTDSSVMGRLHCVSRQLEACTATEFKKRVLSDIASDH